VERLGRIMVIAAIYIGTVVGAGFASGQEIWYFFSRFQQRGLWGLLCSTLVFAILGVKAIEWGRRIKAQSYRELFYSLVGKGYGCFCDGMITLFLFLLIGIMLAGAGAVTNALGWGGRLGVTSALLLTVLVLLKPLTGLKRVNAFVVPLLCLTGLLLNLKGQRVLLPLAPGGPATGNWLVAALQYSAYNLVLALPVLVNLYRLEPDPTVLKWGGIAGGCVLGMLAFFFYTVLTNYDFSGIDLPVLFLTGNWRWGWPFFYSLVLWGELFTSLVANAYGLISRFHLDKTRFYGLKVFLLMVLAAFISQLGFARLIKKIYPFYGYFAFTLLLPLLIRPLPPSKEGREIYRKRHFFDRAVLDIKKRKTLL
jgi:uncharacterized membrane protein YkvI